MRFGRPFRRYATTVALALSALAAATGAIARETGPPQPPREFRAAWVASVHNINWPSKAGLSTAQQKNELIRIFGVTHFVHAPRPGRNLAEAFFGVAQATRRRR